MSLLPAASCLSAQVPYAEELLIPGGHRGTVHTLLHDEQGKVLSAGSDGFLEIWDPRSTAATERFQVSTYGITAMVLRPGTSQVSLIESDGIDRYRVASWDYETKQRRFVQDFRDPISFIAYSGGGTFLILVQPGKSGVSFIHGETGESLKAPDITGTLSFAATGKSERTMIGYAPSGVLSYWDLESGQEIRHFTVQTQIRAPRLFGNNRFLGGIDAGGLVLLDAVSGAVLARERGMAPKFLIALAPEASEFMCLADGSGGSSLYHFGISPTGKLELKNQWPLPRSIPAVMSAVSTADAVVLGTIDGEVWLGKQDGTAALMRVRPQRRITEAAAAASSLGFLTEDQALGFIPLDYTQLEAGGSIPLEQSPYTRITSDSEGVTGAGRLLLWQENTTGSFPILRSVQHGAVQDRVFDQVSRRFPLRAAALRGDQVLLLDAAGNSTVLSATTGETRFSFSSVSALDAALLSDGNIIIGQSVVSGNAPFLWVNSTTGETVPIAVSASVGARVFCGTSGTLYGGTVGSEQGRLSTALIRLSLTSPSRSRPLARCPGEDTGFALAESGGTVASTLGGEGAVIYGSGGNGFAIPFERRSGFPQRLIDGASAFIALDTEGAIAWHDPKSGALLALFHLYAEEWILEKPGAPLIRGGLIRSAE
jgi:hypothetical protein